MGLLEQLGYKGPIAQFIGQNRNVIGQAGLGFAQGRNPSEGFALAGAGALQGRQADDAYATAEKAKADEAARFETAVANMQKYNPTIADIVRARGPEAVEWGWNETWKGMSPQPAAPIKVGENETLLDPTTYQPLYTSPGAGQPDPKEQFGFEKDLYSQYSNADPVKTYSDVRDGYERVRQSAAVETGAGDMGLIYGYMKMLDPGSVVRESEFAMAAQAGSYGQQIQGFVSQILNGQRLAPEVRKAFIQNADGLYKQSANNLSDINNQFTQRAQSWNVDPSTFIRAPESYPVYSAPGFTVLSVEP